MSFHIRPLKEEKEPRWAWILEPVKRVGKRLPWKKCAAMSVMVARPLFALGTRFYRRKEKEKRLKRMTALVAASIVALFILLLTFSMLIHVGGISFTSVIGATGKPIAADTHGITNILLLGQGDEKGIDLTDSIMIASIDPVRTKSVVFLSLPRDLYFLHTDSMETENGKLNALWRDNRILLQKQGKNVKEASLLSLKQLATEIGDALGVDMHHAVKVDFTAFEDVVDAIGGMDVTVPETIHDTEFPGPNYTYQTFHIDAGLQHLDGATALKYARTRSTTSDFDRSKRQQQILKAVAEKAQEIGILKKPRKILELFTILSEHIETDLSTRQMITLAKVAREIEKDRFVSLQLNDVNGLYGDQLFKGGLLYAPPRNLFDGASMLLPVSIPEFPVTWKQVRFLTHLLFEERALYLDQPSFIVLNGGAREGSAGRVARELTKFGFDVSDVANVFGERDIKESFISHNGEGADEATVTFFANLLSMPEQPLPERTEAEGDVTIVLGKDFRFSYFQDLLSL